MQGLTVALGGHALLKVRKQCGLVVPQQCLVAGPGALPPIAGQSVGLSLAGRAIARQERNRNCQGGAAGGGEPAVGKCRGEATAGSTCGHPTIVSCQCSRAPSKKCTSSCPAEEHTIRPTGSRRWAHL